MGNVCLVVSVVLAFCCGETVVSSDWPQFQGPTRNGISPETGLATTWPEAGPRVVWEAAVGRGYAGPVVSEGKVFLLDRKDDVQDILRCFDLQTGTELFSVPCDAPGYTPHNGSRMPVTVDNGRVYGVGLMGDCYCFDIETKALVWRRNLPTDFKIDLTRKNESMWGMAQSPLLHNGLVIVSLQCADKSIAALKPETGETVWTAEQLGFQDYTMPTVATLAGLEQLVMQSGAKDQGIYCPSGKIAGISLQDGSTLWSVENLWRCYTPIAPILALSNERLLITGAYHAGTAMLQVKQEGEGFSVKKLWHQEECGSHMHQPIVFEGYLYENTQENKRDSGMVCISLDDGELMWSTKGMQDAPKFGRGPMLLVDGMILNITDTKGTLCLIKPNPDAYVELARAKVLDGVDIYANMAFSQGKLLIRNLTTMKCLDLRTP